MSHAASATSLGDRVVAVVGIRRAYFYAKSRRDTFITIPAEDWEPGDEGRCGRLRVSLYGTRDAAGNWDLEIK